jgi:hypothetical protein
MDDIEIVDFTDLLEIDEERLRQGLRTGQWTIPIRWIKPPAAHTADSPAPAPERVHDPGTPTDQPPPP